MSKPINTGDIKNTEPIERVKNFLSVVLKMKEPCVIYSSAKLKDKIKKEINRIFKWNKINAIDIITFDKDPFLNKKNEEIEEIFKNSLKDGGVLVAEITKGTPPLVLRRLEQILTDGYIPYQFKNDWRKAEPSENWQLIVWVNNSEINQEDFILKDIFDNKLVLD